MAFLGEIRTERYYSNINTRRTYFISLKKIFFKAQLKMNTCGLNWGYNWSVIPLIELSQNQKVCKNEKCRTYQGPQESVKPWQWDVTRVAYSMDGRVFRIGVKSRSRSNFLWQRSVGFRLRIHFVFTFITTILHSWCLPETVNARTV